MRLYVTTIGYFSKKASMTCYFLFFVTPVKTSYTEFLLAFKHVNFHSKKRVHWRFPRDYCCVFATGKRFDLRFVSFRIPVFFWVRHGKALFFGCVFDFVWQEKRAKKKNSSSFSLHVSCGSPTVAWWALKLQEKMPPPRLGVWGFGDSMNI